MRAETAICLIVFIWAEKSLLEKIEQAFCESLSSFSCAILQTKIELRSIWTKKLCNRVEKLKKTCILAFWHSTLLYQSKCPTEMLTIHFFRIYDPIPILMSKVDLRSDPILSPSWEKDLRSDTFRSFSILFDPFRSDPYHVYLRIQFHKSCVFWISRHF